MSCKFSNFDGKCSLWDDKGIQFEHIAQSCDGEGYCEVESDDDPLFSCEDYEER